MTHLGLHSVADICNASPRANERVTLQFMCLGSLADVTYLRYTVLMSPKKVLVMLVSQNVLHVISALQSTVFTFFVKLEHNT